MGNPVKVLVAGGIVGVIAWAYKEAQAQQVTTTVYTPASASEAPKSNAFLDAFKGGLSSYLGGVMSGGSTQTSTPTGTATAAIPSGSVQSGAGLGALLSLIRKHESGGSYNIVWSGISAADQPPKSLTSMTIGEVLAWQDSIDSRYNSEAAGAYQILEDTLRSYYRSAGLTMSDKFSVANQDRMAIALLERRGLSRYRAGTYTDVQFAQEISKEWASFPCQTKDKRGRAATGQSYYAGDGLNQSLTSRAEVLAAVRAI